ncbi:high frequency lysogenization protein HflD [Marinomonas atlantica]|uniref:high frequency lysogenization protein HflD n=1 Tax=Marinomonas atlantica TaxID=1806668 RepID=UPI0008366D7D|nr:high frequency lysogenization protein HflD [Marinomonas atlantica]MCO4786283.1 high frequency lysogenization protein HflD [Marinomonas atlantica]
MQHSEKEQAIALAAIFQAAELVANLARKGNTDQSYAEPMLNSILMVNAPATEDIYGGQFDCQGNLALGRRIATEVMGKGKDAVNPDTIRYALSMIHLESKLHKDSDMLSAIGQRLNQLERQLEHYESVMHENVIAGISGMYQDTLSKLSFRIQVHGDSRFLQQPHIAHQVRAILMAGIRAAMLWRQVGGRRWHLIFKRKALLKQLEGRF